MAGRRRPGAVRRSPGATAGTAARSEAGYRPEAAGSPGRGPRGAAGRPVCGPLSPAVAPCVVPGGRDGPGGVRRRRPKPRLARRGVTAGPGRVSAAATTRAARDGQADIRGLCLGGGARSPHGGAAHYGPIVRGWRRRRPGRTERGRRSRLLQWAGGRAAPSGGCATGRPKASAGGARGWGTGRGPRRLAASRDGAGRACVDCWSVRAYNQRAMPAGSDLFGLRAFVRRILYGRRPARTCRYCGRAIYWRRSPGGSYRPVNGDGSRHVDRNLR